MSASAPPGPAAATRWAVAVDLPVHLTDFVGRARELGDLSRLLASTRLLTLTGAGGSGKTRLAREVAARSAGHFDHVGWVDLAGLSDPAFLDSEVATQLRVPERVGTAPFDAIVSALAGSRTLIVLDNCEHLVAACAALVEALLRAASGVTVLATSREALGVPSETAWLVPPLAGDEAIQLFADRARAALPAFSISDSNAATLRDICRRLDGIPLAIELAAARVRVLSPEQIAARLDDAFRLLTGGSRTALPRQRTLRGTMDWSYDLLEHREQVLLARLGVFSGRFSLEATEDVCVGDPLESEDILDGVAALVDRSLVVMHADEGTARYRLLETVRQYALERLADAGELERYRERHARYFLAFAESVAPQLFGGVSERGLVARVGLDHDNLRVAGAWSSADPARGEEALRFADALFWYWYSSGFWLGTGQFSEAREYIARALDGAPHASAILRGRAWSANGLCALAQGDWPEARRSFETSLILIRAHDDGALVAFVLSKLGASLVMLGDPGAAQRALDEAYERSRPMAPQMLHAFVYFWRSWAALDRGDQELAGAMAEAHMQLSRDLSHRAIFAHASALLGRLRYAQGNLDAAFARFSEGLRAHLEVGDGWGIAMQLEGLLSIAVSRGRFGDGVRLMGAVDALRERIATALPASDRRERERLYAIACRELGEETDRVYAEGTMLPMDAVVILANGGEAAPSIDTPTSPSREEPRARLPERSIPRIALAVRALGPLEVLVGDERVESTAWGSARPRELLIYLLLHPDGRTREQVGVDLWPEASAAQLRNSFHVTLHRLRKALRHPEWVITSNERYRVNAGIVREFDVDVFDRDVTEARRGIVTGIAGASAALERALTRYRGDLLDGEPVGDWHRDHRDRLQRVYVDALMLLGDRQASEERYEKALDTYRRLLARDELHDDAVRALMRCLIRVGQRSEAIRTYRRFAERLERELRAKPDPRTTELFVAAEREGA